MKLLIILFLILIGLSPDLPAQQTVPFRDTASYEFILDYNFKRKSPPPGDLVSNNQNRFSHDLLPYVKVKLKVLHLEASDYRVQIITNKGNAVYNKRIKEPMEIILDMGFAEDIKERLIPHLYYVNFLDKEKNVHSTITIEVAENGRFLVNDKLYGQL